MEPFFTEIALLSGVGLLSGIILLISFLSIPAGLPTTLLLIVAGVVAFLCGFFVRRSVQYIISTRRRKR